MGVQCNGRTRDFDSRSVGSIPAAPTMQTTDLPLLNAVVLHTSSFLAASLFGGVAFLCLFCGQQRSEPGLLTSRLIDDIIYDE